MTLTSRVSTAAESAAVVVERAFLVVVVQVAVELVVHTMHVPFHASKLAVRVSVDSFGM